MLLSLFNNKQTRKHSKTSKALIVQLPNLLFHRLQGQKFWSQLRQYENKIITVIVYQSSLKHNTWPEQKTGQTEAPMSFQHLMLLHDILQLIRSALDQLFKPRRKRSLDIETSGHWHVVIHKFEWFWCSVCLI